MKEVLKPAKFNFFALFAIFYSTALWLEMAENWENPRATLITLGLLLSIIVTGINKLKFCLFIGFTTAYFLYFHFPEVANHVNLILFINLALLVGAIYTWLRPRKFAGERDYYAVLQPLIRISLITVYFWAGFHKLNRDFFNPYHSCSNSMLTGIIELLFSSVFGIPTWLILVAIAFFFTSKITPWQQWRLLQKLPTNLFIKSLLVGLLILVLFSGAIVYFDLAKFIKPLAVLATAIMVVVWELGGSVLLFFPRWQAPIFFLSMFMHLVLAPIGFVDFGSLAFALWLTFIPKNYYSKLDINVNLSFINISINRSLIYVVLNVLGGIISGIYYLAYPNFNIKAIAGIIFIISVLIVIYPSLKTIVTHPYSWRGVPVLNRKMPRFMYIFVVLLFLFAMTPYLGLRTAGNFSMFSNLRTEVEVSNHLLLGSNPLKIWNYQEDVVKFIEIDDEKAKIGHKYRPLKGNYLPVVEFKKLIHKWTKAEYQVPLVFEYGDRIYATTDIINDPVWRTPKRNWEMMLMDFRVIQPDNGEPNYCQW